MEKTDLTSENSISEEVKIGSKNALEVPISTAKGDTRREDSNVGDDLSKATDRKYESDKARSNLLDFANKSRLAKRYNDVVVCVVKGRFPANSLVLAAASKYFEKLFEENQGQTYSYHVAVEGVDKTSMEALIEFIYTGNIIISEKNVENILSGANVLQIKDVEEYCLKFLYDEITIENCCHVLEIVIEYKNKAMEAKTIQFISENFKAVTATEAYKLLNKFILIRGLSRLDETYLEGGSIDKALIEQTIYDEAERVAEFSIPYRDDGDLSKLPLGIDSNGRAETIVHQLQRKVRIGKSKTGSDVKTNLNPQTEYVGSRILSLGGLYTPSSVFEVYNRTNERPAFYPRLPGGRCSGGAAVLDGGLYYVGGLARADVALVQSSNDVWCLKMRERPMDHQTDMIDEKTCIAEQRWKPIQTMKAKRDCVSATLFKGKLVVFGGRSSIVTSLSSGESYSPSLKKWKDIAPLQQARYDHALVACQDHLYAIGGLWDFDKTFGGLSSVERLTTDDDGWEYVASMQIARSGFAAVCYRDCIYAIGGKTNKGNVNTVEKFDPETNKWNYVKPMQFKRWGCSACVMQELIYVVGGRDEGGHQVKQVERYDPAAGWRVVKEIEERLWFHSLVVV